MFWSKVAFGNLTRVVVVVVFIYLFIKTERLLYTTLEKVTRYQFALCWCNRSLDANCTTDRKCQNFLFKVKLRETIGLN